MNMMIGPGIVPLARPLRAEIERSGILPWQHDWIHKLEATPPGGRLVYWDSPHPISGDTGLMGFFMRLQMLRAVDLFQERAYEPRTDFVSSYFRYLALRRDGYVPAPGGAAASRPRAVEAVARPYRPHEHPRHGMAYFEQRRSASGALSSR